MRDYTDCDAETTEIVLRFRQLIGRISIVMDADRMGATINLEGPISALAKARGDLTGIPVRKGDEIWPARTRLDDLFGESSWPATVHTAFRTRRGKISNCTSRPIRASGELR